MATPSPMVDCTVVLSFDAAAGVEIGVGTPPALGAALCDRLCFRREVAKADALRSALLQRQRAQHARAGRLEVHVSNGNLPWWWLLFCASICVPFQVTFGILSLVLVPADVAALVGDSHKAKYLGSESPRRKQPHAQQTIICLGALTLCRLRLLYESQLP